MRKRSGLSSVCLSAIQSSFYTPRNAKCLIVGFFSAKYLSFMKPRRNEQSPDFKMRFGDSISHSFSVTQTHEDQMHEEVRSPGKGLTTEYRANFLGIFVGVARWLGSPD